MSDIIIKPADWNIQAAKYGIKPGDRVILQGNRAELEFHDLKGTKENPIVVTATEKIIIKRSGTGGRVVHFFNCDYIVFTGTEKKLIEITGGGHGVTFHDGSNHLEVSNLHIHHVGYSGIDITNYPTCDPKTWRGAYTMEDIYVKDNKITDLTDGEAIYIGGSHYHTSFPLSNCPSGAKTALEHDAKNIHVTDNEIRNVGADGIQIGSATGGAYVTGNTVENFGVKKVFAQNAGIIMNPGTIAEVAYNTVNTGTGFGIQLQGPGGSYVHNNLVVNTGTVDGGGIMQVNYMPNGKTDRVVNNTFVNISRVGVEFYNPVEFSGNVLNTKAGIPLYKQGGGLGKMSKSLANVELAGDLSSLRLDTAYVPTATSPVPDGVGYADYQKPKPVVVKEAGSVELITTDGIESWYLTTPSGKKKKIE